MSGGWWWSYLLTAVGVAGFILASRKVWWAWYVNIACQFLWLAYALATAQYGFIIASAVYFVVFTRNAVHWTREHRALVAMGPPDPTNPLDLRVPPFLRVSHIDFEPETS